MDRIDVCIRQNRGATLVTVNTNYKVFEAEYLLKQSDTDTLVMMDGLKDTNYSEIINELCPELKDSKPGRMDCENLPYLKRVIYLDAKENMPRGMLHWSELRELAASVSDEALRARQASVNCHDVVNMQYTSGTTGFPKGVMLTHYNILNNGKCIGDNQVLTYRDRVCLPVPFFHCFGCVLGIMACITHGSTIVPVERYHPVRVMHTIQAERCTATYGRSDHVHCHAGASRFFQIRFFLAAHRDHVRLALPGKGHGAGRQSDAYDGNYDPVRLDRNVSRVYDDKRKRFH